MAVGQVLQPRLHGKNLNLDPVVVVLSLAFWSLIWGVAGAFLSIPLTVIAMAILAEFPDHPLDRRAAVQRRAALSR